MRFSPRPRARHEALRRNVRNPVAFVARRPDIEALAARAVDALQKERSGLRAEQLRLRLGIARKELPMALAMALSTKAIKKTGQKRATTYFHR